VIAYAHLRATDLELGQILEVYVRYPQMLEAVNRAHQHQHILYIPPGLYAIPAAQAPEHIVQRGPMLAFFHAIQKIMAVFLAGQILQAGCI
jgi:hypothetical protein